MNTRDDILTKDELGESGDRRLVPAPSLDLAKYRALADEIEIPEADFDEFLGTLWSIMNGFVQNAWDIRFIPAFLPEVFDDSSGAGGVTVDSSFKEDTDDQA